MRYWVQGQDSKTYGPYEPAEIQRLMAEGRLRQDCLACEEGGSQWATISTLLGPPQALTTSSGQVPATKVSGLIVAAWVLGPMALFCSCLTGIPAIVCASIAMGQPDQRSRAIPALIVAIICQVLGLICGLLMQLPSLAR